MIRYGLLVFTLFLASGQSLETITPSQIYHVSLKSNGKIREFLTANDGFRFLVQSSNGDFHLLTTGLDGQPKAELGISAKMATGLVATSSGFATIVFRDRKPVLIQFDRTGSVVQEKALDCAGADSLLVISGNPATVCSDGNVVEHKPNGDLDRKASWIRPGSAAEILDARTAVIVDRSTAEAVINDLESGRLLVVARIPEIEEIVKATHGKYKDLELKLVTGDARMGKPLVIMDTAQYSSVWYSLVWPYDPKSGALVVSFDITGKPVRKLLCRVPGHTSPVHKIEVRGSRLYLVSSAGDIYEYTM